MRGPASRLVALAVFIRYASLSAIATTAGLFAAHLFDALILRAALLP